MTSPLYKYDAPMVATSLPVLCCFPNIVVMLSLKGIDSAREV